MPLDDLNFVFDRKIDTSCLFPLVDLSLLHSTIR